MSKNESILIYSILNVIRSDNKINTDIVNMLINLIGDTKSQNIIIKSIDILNSTKGNTYYIQEILDYIDNRIKNNIKKESTDIFSLIVLLSDDYYKIDNDF